MLKGLLLKPWGWLIILALVVLAVVLFAVEKIPPRDLTVTRIDITEVRMRAYWKANGRLPVRLSDLPKLSGRDNSTTDGWGRDIQFKVIGPTTVTLTSLGADGSVGGTGLNEDIVDTFDASKTP